MSQLILKPEKQEPEENITWLAMANKYIDGQYEQTDSCADKALHKKSTFDEGFMKEYDIITQIIKL